MGHTPLGYHIKNGKAIIDEENADRIRNLYKHYLSGLSFTAAAKKAGLSVLHAGAKRMMTNAHYLGDDFYPAIIDKETFDKAREEMNRRSKKLGRNNLYKETPPKEVPLLFRFGDIKEYYDNPVKQAEYLYSLIESEVI